MTFRANDKCFFYVKTGAMTQENRFLLMSDDFAKSFSNSFSCWYIPLLSLCSRYNVFPRLFLILQQYCGSGSISVWIILPFRYLDPPSLFQPAEPISFGLPCLDPYKKIFRIRIYFRNFYMNCTLLIQLIQSATLCEQIWILYKIKGIYNIALKRVMIKHSFFFLEMKSCTKTTLHYSIHPFCIFLALFFKE